jgi:hypothetical protein
MGSRNNPSLESSFIIPCWINFFWAQQPHFSAMRSSSCHRSTLKIQPPFSPDQRSAIKQKFWMLGAQVTSTVTGLSWKAWQSGKPWWRWQPQSQLELENWTRKLLTCQPFHKNHSCTCERCEPSILGHAKFDARSLGKFEAMVTTRKSQRRICRQTYKLELPLCLESNLTAQSWERN